MSTCNIFLDLVFTRYGRADGEAVAEGFEGQIEVIGFDWGLGRPDERARASQQQADAEFQKDRAANQHAIDTGIDPKTGKELSGKDRFALIRAMAAKLILPSANQVSLKEFNFTKRFDLASTVMLNALNSQDEIKEACFTVLQQGQATEKLQVRHAPHYVIKLRRGRVKALGLALESAGNKGKDLVDTVAFGYRGVDVSYYPGGKEGAMPFSYSAPGPG